MSQHPVLWTPSQSDKDEANITRLIKAVRSRFGIQIEGYEDLHKWSIDHREDFWSLIWDETGIIGEKGDRVLANDHLPGASFFPDAQLNFAENLLRKKGPQDALVFWGEDKVKRRMSWDELHALVSRLQQAFQDAGVTEGDRIAAMLPNCPEAIACMLAATSIGATWSSCSPDFGEGGVLDRFGQIEPTLFISCDGYWYNGKQIDVADKLVAISSKLQTTLKTIIIPYLGREKDIAAQIEKGVTLSKFLEGFDAKEVAFTRLGFNHPLYILFSSGTTGIPKCIVHTAGGILIQHLKEHRYHSGIGPQSRFFYFTTLGWMMWNWLVTGLASDATLILYDGSPFVKKGHILFEMAQEEKISFFGTSAKFIDAVKKEGIAAGIDHDLSSIKVISSTGSPLAPESFDYVYDRIKKDVHLASVSGGTDIASCFVIGVPTMPVRKGEIQAAGLGMACEVWNDSGSPVREEKGELVCTKAFPSMPLKFWNDTSGAKYHAAYFDRFDGVWCHGDYAEWTENGGMIIHGRSDATLNPGGVRIGTAEIYNQVEQLDEVIEGICIGQEWDNDVRVILFVRLAQGHSLTEDLVKKIKTQIRTGASPRHVPAKVLAVGDIPRTKSGKIVELAVREVVHDRPVKNVEALANPEALALFKGLDALKT